MKNHIDYLKTKSMVAFYVLWNTRGFLTETLRTHCGYR